MQISSPTPLTVTYQSGGVKCSAWTRNDARVVVPSLSELIGLGSGRVHRGV